MVNDTLVHYNCAIEFICHKHANAIKVNAFVCSCNAFNAAAALCIIMLYIESALKVKLTDRDRHKLIPV